jgi:hypothetical protein
MSCTVKILTSTDEIMQIGGLWQTIGDAAGDIDGGDFWSLLHDRFQDGVTIKEIRIVPEEPCVVERDEDEEEK